MSDLLTKEILELARLLIPDKSKTRKNLYVSYINGAWCIKRERENEPFKSFDLKRAAIDNAKAALKEGDATAVIIFNEQGRIQEIIQ